MNVRHVSFDIETWGTEPGCDIRSIGACLFDPLTGMYPMGSPNGLNRNLMFYIACDNSCIGDEQRYRDQRLTPPRKYPLTRDPRTVQWWSEQSDEAQAAFADPVDLRDALFAFGEWLHTVLDRPISYPDGAHRLTDDVRLWSHGSHFDSPILAAAYRACGLPVPWHYRAPRDTRTAFDLAGIDDHSAHLAAHPGPLGIPHHALDDAICQARAVCAAFDIIGAWRNAHEECERDL